MNKLKRVGALVVVFLLVSLYITTLVLAFIDGEQAFALFKGCIVATIALPVLLYAYILMFKYLKGRGVDEQTNEVVGFSSDIKEKANFSAQNTDKSHKEVAEGEK